MIICVFLGATTLAAAMLTLGTDKTYRSEAKVMIRIGRESVSTDPTIMGPTISVYQVRESEVNSELAIMRSRAIAEGVVAALGTEKFIPPVPEKPDGPRQVLKRFLGSSAPIPPREFAVEKIKKGLKIDVEPKSYIINLQYEDNSPELAQQVLASVLSLYGAQHIEAHRSQASPAFFQRQSDEMLAALYAKEAELERFKEQRGIASVDSQRTILLNQLSEMQTGVDREQSAASQAQAKIEAYEKALAGRKADVSVEAMQHALVELRAREAQMAFRYRDDNEILIRMRAQIRQTEEALQRARSANASQVADSDQNIQAVKLALAHERAQLQAAQAGVRTLTEEMAVRGRRLDELVGHELTVVRLQREIEDLRQDYLKNRENLLRANISNSLDQEKSSNASIIQQASLSRIPVKPNPALNVAMGLVAGLLGGVMLALILDWFDGRMRAGREVEEKLGLPVLAVIPERSGDDGKSVRAL